MKNFIASSMKRFGLQKPNLSEKSPNQDTNNQSYNDPLGHLRIGSKWSYATLEYPSDIQTRSDLGHYMMFYINVANSNKSKYSRIGGIKNGKFKQKTTRRGGGGTDAKVDTGFHGIKKDSAQDLITSRKGHAKDADAMGDYDVAGGTWKPGQSERVIARKSWQGAVSKKLKQEDRTVRTTDSIVLYMPPQVMENNAANYNATEIGGEIMETAGRAMSIISRAEQLGGDMKGGLDAMKEALPGIAGQVKSAMFRGAAKAASALMGGDALAAYDKYSNRAMNNFLETTFKGVGFRKFSYTWKFTPKSIDEVIAAQDIIKTFKFHMLPELPETDDFGRYYIVPAEFDIFYMFRGDENEFFNKIATSVLVNMDVNYSPGQYQTFRPIDGFDGAPPTEIDMKLDFQEPKVITKADVEEGF